MPEDDGLYFLLDGGFYGLRLGQVMVSFEVLELLMPIGMLKLALEFAAWETTFFISCTRFMGSACAAGWTVIFEHVDAPKLLPARGGRLRGLGQYPQ